MSKIIIFNRKDLPQPFDKVGSKKVKESSKYGDGTDATLTITVIKGIHAICRCKNNTGEGALGLTGKKTVVEYKSAVEDDYHIVVYDPDSGNMMAGIYNVSTETNERYTVSSKGRDGAALLMAIFPELVKDDEFKDHFEAYYEEFNNSFPDFDEAKKHMAIMCDNAYRRIADETCEAHIKLTVDKSGNLMPISRMHLDKGDFIPSTVMMGEFAVFAQTGPIAAFVPTESVDHNDFVGKYTFDISRRLSVWEQKLVPDLKPWYVLPPEVIEVCKHAHQSTEKEAPMRNFLFRGPAGTGKTAGARAIAAGLGLPYMKYTCHAQTEEFDFIGQVLPAFSSVSTGNEDMDRELAELNEMGGITYSNVKTLMKLPDLDDLDYDPGGVYFSLTGKENGNATTQECLEIVMELVTEKVRTLSMAVNQNADSAPKFTYFETDFIKALKYGYVVEIQEPSNIVQPSVLTGLNDLLEQEGSIRLPTGEFIRRHPDAVVIITTNVEYEGCRNLNQAFTDRMSIINDIPMPEPEVMLQRAMNITGCEDEHMVSQMVKVVCDMADYMHKNGITDGVCGFRSLTDWIISTEITGDPYLAALSTVISRATSDAEDQETLKVTVLEPFFRPKVKSDTA